VAQVKSVIHTTSPEFLVEAQKLIHAGKVLKDDQIIGESGIKDRDFLVIMIMKVNGGTVKRPHPFCAI